MDRDEELQRAKDLGRAEGYIDAAALLRSNGAEGLQLTTPEQFNQASLTFRNAAISIYRRLGVEPPP